MKIGEATGPTVPPGQARARADNKINGTTEGDVGDAESAGPLMVRQAGRRPMDTHQFSSEGHTSTGSTVSYSTILCKNTRMGYDGKRRCVY